MIPSFYRGMQFYKILFSEYCRVPCRNSLRRRRIRRVRGRNSRCHDPNPRARVSKLGSRKIAKFFRSADYSPKACRLVSVGNVNRVRSSRFRHIDRTPNKPVETTEVPCPNNVY
jgi:hypothetical protein